MPDNAIEVSLDGSYLSIPIEGQRTRFHAFWLRDNARNAETVSPQNGQRVITLLDQPETIVIDDARFAEDGSCQVIFSDDPVKYDYPQHWLAENRYDFTAKPFYRLGQRSFGVVG